MWKVLDLISPFELQEKWDNSGLNVGEWQKRIEKVYVSVDMDEELVRSLEPGSLIITHHPLIFSPIKRIDYSSYPDKILVELIKKDIAHIALHTNFDKTHLNRYVATKVLGAKGVECEGFVCYFEKKMGFEEALEWVRDSFGLQCLRFVKGPDKIEKIALTTGSGGGLIDSVKADLFLTGDLKYHDAVKAQILGLGVIDIGHFESERFFAEVMADELKKYSIEAIIAPVKNPLNYKG